MMLTIEDALLKVRENPIKYIGKKSLKRLDLFMLGYSLCQTEREGTSQNFVGEFQTFIEKKYNIIESIRFSRIIQNYSISDECAFDIFYELLDEFYEKQ